MTTGNPEVQEVEPLSSNSGPAVSPEEVQRILRTLGRGDEPASQDRVGKFEVLQLLSCSGQAIVLLAYDPELQRRVVLKLYPSDGVREHSQRMLAEGRALARISSPFVATCFGTEQVEGNVFLVIEHVEGQPLSEVLAQRRVSAQEAVRITMEIASGVVAVHAEGLLHGDLKPGNVIVSRKGSAKLIDFGLVTPLSKSQQRARAGTTAYMPPEVARCEPEKIDQRTDVFGLGAILYHLLTGQAPFTADSSTAALELSRQGKIVPAIDRCSVPPTVNAITMMCLSADPSARPASAGILLRSLQDFARSSNFNRQRSRRRAVVLGFAFIVATAAIVWRSRTPNSQNEARRSTLNAPSQAEALPLEGEQSLPPPSTPWLMSEIAQQQMTEADAGDFERVYELELDRLPTARHQGDVYTIELRLAQIAECIPDYSRALIHQERAVELTQRDGLRMRRTFAERRRTELLWRRDNGDRASILQARRAFLYLEMEDVVAGYSGRWRENQPEYAQEVARLHVDLFGADSLAAAECMSMERRWLHRLYKHEQALPVAKAVYDSYHALLGPASHHAIVALSDYAGHCVKLQTPGHQLVAEEAYEMARTHFGAHNVLTLDAFQLIGRVHLQNERYDSARLCLSESIEIAQVVRPSSCPMLLILLSKARLGLGLTGEALDDARRAEALLDAEDESGRPRDRMFVYEQLALAASLDGQPAVTTEYCTKATEIARTMFKARPRMLVYSLWRAMMSEFRARNKASALGYAVEVEEIVDRFELTDSLERRIRRDLAALYRVEK